MKTIIFSLTCHESIECVIDLIENVIFFNPYFKSLFLISTTESLYKEFVDKKILTDNIIIVTIREDNMRVWGHLNLFNQHCLNLKYIFDNNIEFKYFTLLASNQYFIKNITPEKMEDVCHTIISQYEDNITNFNDYWDDLIQNRKQGWETVLFSDIPTIDYFIKNKIKYFKFQHEGCVLDYKSSKIIKDAYFDSKIFDNSLFINHIWSYPMEEYFIFCYLKSKYILKNNGFKSICAITCWDEDRTITNYNNLLLNDDIISLKPIKRIYNDPIRSFLRNKFK
jgi:hypothetical protein